MLATDGDCTRATSGELALLAAVLQRAIDDARAGRRDAVAWIASDASSGTGEGWTFVAVCDLLGCSPDWVRGQAARGGVRTRRPRMRFAKLEAAA